MTTTLVVLHPKGGVGRSTTAYVLGAELALRGHRVALIDRDQGQHLSRVFDFYPPPSATWSWVKTRARRCASLTQRPS